MGKGYVLRTDVLSKLFCNTALSWDANTNLYISLHTADPIGGGDLQTTSEATYTSYARVAVARTTGGFTVTSPSNVGTVTNAAAITFPACTGGSNTITNFAVGTASSGGGEILYSGSLTSSLSVSNGITPQFAIGALTCTEV